MVKKSPATPAKKAPAKRKPRAKKPVAPITRPAETESTTSAIAWKTYAKNIAFGFAMLAAGVAGGWWSAGGIKIGPTPRSDVLQQAYDRDRVTQVAVLRELAEQPFDGATDDGRKAAGEWYNSQRFRNRAVDYVPFTDAVAESIAANAEAELAKKLGAK